MPLLEVNIAPRHPSGLVLKNPVITASGTFGYGTEYASIYDVNRLGAIAAKAVTLRPRSGNPMPRIVEVPGGMLNAIGLQNVGAEALIRDKAPIWARWNVPVIANVAGASLEEFVTIAEMLDGAPGIAALELNISCPNVAHGLDFGTDPAMAGAVTQAVSERSSLPLIVKLTPNVTDIRPVATAVAEAGAHALAIMNTLSGLAIDVAQKRPRAGHHFRRAIRSRGAQYRPAPGIHRGALGRHSHHWHRRHRHHRGRTHVLDGRGYGSTGGHGEFLQPPCAIRDHRRS